MPLYFSKNGQWHLLSLIKVPKINYIENCNNEKQYRFVNSVSQAFISVLVHSIFYLGLVRGNDLDTRFSVNQCVPSIHTPTLVFYTVLFIHWDLFPCIYKYIPVFKKQRNLRKTTVSHRSNRATERINICFYFVNIESKQEQSGFKFFWWWNPFSIILSFNTDCRKNHSFNKSIWHPLWVSMPSGKMANIVDFWYFAIGLLEFSRKTATLLPILGISFPLWFIG